MAGRASPARNHGWPRLLTGSRKRHFVKSPPPSHMRPQGPSHGCIRTKRATQKAPRARGVLLKSARLSASEAGPSKSAIMRQAPARWPLPSTSCAGSGRKKKQRSSPLSSEFLLPRNAVALRCHLSATRLGGQNDCSCMLETHTPWHAPDTLHGHCFRGHATPGAAAGRNTTKYPTTPCIPRQLQLYSSQPSFRASIKDCGSRSDTRGKT